MKVFIPVVVFGMLIGCASVPDVDIAVEGSISIPSDSDVCVVFPKDGIHEGKQHEGSGVKVGEIIFNAIPKAYKTVHVTSAKDCAGSYLVTSNILEYENRASGWSGKPDKIKVKVVASSPDESETSSFTYYADSNMAASALFEWGNAAPYTLLDGKFKKQVGMLIRGQ